MTIDELDTNYCDDFECTSSPAIEQTIRSLARDLTRLKYTIRLFQPDVQYSDGFRSFKGSEKYSRPFWPRDSVTDPRVVRGWADSSSKSSSKSRTTTISSTSRRPAGDHPAFLNCAAGSAQLPCDPGPYQQAAGQHCHTCQQHCLHLLQAHPDRSAAARLPL
jgi:hypothetical protein